MTNSRPDLEQLASLAETKGRHMISGVCRRALAHIDALEAELQRRRGNPQLGALTRHQRMTPEQRTNIARLAAQRRWHPTAPHA